MTDRFTTDSGDGTLGAPMGGVDRDELLQLAELEARGVIEPTEDLRLERLFAAASPSLQAEVRAMQERLELEPALRSDEVPSESLRLPRIYNPTNTHCTLLLRSNRLQRSLPKNLLPR